MVSLNDGIILVDGKVLSIIAEAPDMDMCDAVSVTVAEAEVKQVEE
ncbi:hypothetical protein JCM17380_02060 [Desulfosporosinus burensis]